MDQQEKTPQQRRSRAKNKPIPVEEQANQPTTMLPQDHGNHHEASPAKKQQNQPPTPPEQPKTDDSDVWKSYRGAWQAYSDAWRSYWETQGEQECAEQEEGESVYRAAWRTHWQEKGLLWRTEPEIDQERQRFLTERKAFAPDIEKGIYLFKDIKLIRADVEWLLETHENGRGPIDWKDSSQRERKGLDLRGADLHKVDLRGLPLAGMQGGLTGAAWFFASPEEAIMAAAHLEESILIRAHLEGAKLNQTCLTKANLFRASLEGAEVSYADFTKAHLNETTLGGTLWRGARLEGADLRRAVFVGATTPPANLRGIFFDRSTTLTSAKFNIPGQGTVSVADVHWGEVNLSVLDWSKVELLGDEFQARHPKEQARYPQWIGNRDTPLTLYQRAVRANRQLAIVLKQQGLNEEADRFSYRAQLLQRVVLRRKKKYLKYFGSWILWLIAGYGYRPLRSFLIYLILIFGFATAYFFVGPIVGVPFSPLGAIVFSVTSFHGRGFFPGGSPGLSITLDDPLTVVAATEAVFGLLIEISFIATFTQRYFGK